MGNDYFERSQLVKERDRLQEENYVNRRMIERKGDSLHNRPFVERLIEDNKNKISEIEQKLWD